ncbi:MAG: DUF6585 family protein [Anaerolineales bacterium]
MNPTDSPFASVIGLGALKGEYAPNSRGRWVAVILGGLMLAAAPVLLLVAAYIAYSNVTNFGMLRLWRNLPLPLIGAAVVGLIGVLALFNSWRNWRLAAALYENGVAYVGQKGITQVAWPDVTAVWQRVTKHYTNGVYTGTTHSYTLQTNTGEKIVLDDRLGKKVEELGTAVQAGVTNTLLPRYWQSLQTGQRLNFGPLGLDREKLYAGNKELRWTEIKAIKINKGMVSVRKDQAWLNWTSVTVPQIPNFFVFFELVGRFAKIE